MGFAAFMIMCLHAYWKPDFWLWNFFINKYGNAGVDIFVFLAGFGLAFSLEKKPNFHRYYVHRLERILPAYYIAMVIKLIVCIATGTLTLKWLIATFIPLGVWIDATPQFWYVSATLGYYLIAPLIFNLFKSSRFPRLTMVALVILTGVFVPIVANIEPKAVMRIPALVIGLGTGVFQNIHSSKKDRWMDLALLAGFFICGILIMSGSAIFDLPILNLVKLGHPTRLWKDLTAPFATVAVAYAFELIGRSSLHFVKALFDRLGEYSYEIYIGHLIIVYFAKDIFKNKGLVLLISMLVFSYPAALLLALGSRKILSGIKKLPLIKSSDK